MLITVISYVMTKRKESLIPGAVCNSRGGGTRGGAWGLEVGAVGNFV